jgi:phage shock protein PspC (stress-responsive transcriptional regulator)
MKKTFTINISGTVFHIDDDAYDKLSTYIAQINKHFGHDTDAQEIIEDIESRIAELFQERLKNGKEVVTLDQVNEIIAIMGMPDSFDDSIEEEKVVDSPSSNTKSSKGRRLYRDPENKILGGVCGGLSAYFGIDPVVIRLIFVALVFLGAGSSILIYFILWIIVPKATNSAQRLEMKGEPVNINNISKNIKEEFQEVKEMANKIKSEKPYLREKAESLGNIFLSMIKIALRVFAIIFGIILVLVGILAVIVLITSMFITDEFLGITPFGGDIPSYLNLFVSSTTLFWFWVGAGLAIGIPLLALAYLGIKILFKIRTDTRRLRLSALGLWIVGIILVFTMTVKAVEDYKASSSITKQEPITTKSDTLYLKLGNNELGEAIETHINFGKLKIAKLNGKNFLIDEPTLDIVKSDNADYSLVVKTKARGKNLEAAQHNASEITYKLDVQDSLITFQSNFLLLDKAAYHNQDVNYTLKVPVNKTIYLSQEMTKIIHDIKNTSDMWDGDMGDKYWTMKQEGLELTQRKQLINNQNTATK